MQQTRGSGSDFLQLDPASAPARGRSMWLAARLREAITTGQVPDGAPLPATRVLAADLGWARGVVVQAYQRLGEEGLTSGRARAGTRVRRPSAHPHDPRPGPSSRTAAPRTPTGSPARSPARSSARSPAGQPSAHTTPTILDLTPASRT
ncbi:winged helix-turn-helix domain-containing protein [Kineococcus endophyticus]|uniref:Winged helix-turn-helix domain-containing protein n=1 Tax=Kineococcus endophyticus TaxID=1181883 RepID=A0ABV3PCY9_9ACTN